MLTLRWGVIVGSWLLAGSASGAPPVKVDVCHVTRGNARIISVSENALHGLVTTQGDEVVPADDSCAGGVGVCIND